MGFGKKIIDAYNGIFGRTGKDSVSDGYDFGMLSEIDELEDSTMEQQSSLLLQLNPEMRKYISSSDDRTDAVALQPKVIPISLMTDAPTATQILTLLGMIRWSLEKSSETGKKVRFEVVVNNRNESPLLIGMGDVSIPKVAVQKSFEIGN